jgi:hypothetical protein
MAGSALLDQGRSSVCQIRLCCLKITSQPVHWVVSALHARTEGRGDGPTYTPSISLVLRESLPFPVSDVYISTIQEDSLLSVPRVRSSLNTLSTKVPTIIQARDVPFFSSPFGQKGDRYATRNFSKAMLMKRIHLHLFLCDPNIFSRISARYQPHGWVSRSTRSPTQSLFNLTQRHRLTPPFRWHTPSPNPSLSSV